jgi:hypothetical protein
MHVEVSVLNRFKNQFVLLTNAQVGQLFVLCSEFSRVNKVPPKRLQYWNPVACVPATNVSMSFVFLLAATIPIQSRPILFWGQTSQKSCKKAENSDAPTYLPSCKCVRASWSRIVAGYFEPSDFYKIKYVHTYVYTYLHTHTYKGTYIGTFSIIRIKFALSLITLRTVLELA